MAARYPQGGPQGGAGGSSSSGPAGTAAVDWRVVGQELAQVPADFKDPKFYALKHVVEILTAEDPRSLVAELRDQEEVLAELVEAMVQGYHSGFARSIQNYSQILQLFGEAKDQVVGLKKALADASRQLSAQSRTLQQQWRKSLALESSLALLDGIQLVAAAPEAIDKAAAAKSWSAAVSLLMEACSKLVKDGIAKVGALRRLKCDMVTISLMLEAQLLQELHSRVFTTTAAAAAAAQQQQPAAGGSSGSAGGSSRLGQLQLQGGSGGGVQRGLGSGLGQEGSGDLSPMHGSSRSSSMPAFVMDALHPNGTPAAAAANVTSSSSIGGGGALTPSTAAAGVSAAGAAASAGGGGTGGPGKGGGASSGTSSVDELVSCLMMLDALEDAKMYLLLHARAGVRQMVLRVLETWVQQQEQLASESAPMFSSSSSSSRAGGRFTAAAGSSSPVRGIPSSSTAPTAAAAAAGKDAWAVSPATQIAAQQLLSAVLDACLKALANMGVLLQDMVDTATAHTTRSRSKGGSSGSRGGSSGTKPAAGSSSGGGSVVQHSAAALQQLKQQQQQHHRSDSSGGGAAADALTAAAGATGAAATAAAAAGALDPLAALQSMQSGLLPTSSVTYAAAIAASLGVTAAGGGSSSSSSSSSSIGLYGPNGLATGTIQGLEWAKATGRTPIGLLKTQCAHLWQEMQAEVLLLLGELLRASLKGGGAGGAAAGAARQGGWLADFAELGARAGGQLLSAAGSTSAAAMAAAAGGGSSTAAAAAAGGSGSSGGSFTGHSGGSVTGGGAGFSGGGAPLGGFAGQTGSNLSFKFDLSASELTPGVSAAAAAAGGGAGAGGASTAAAAAAAGAAAAGGGGAAAAAVAAGEGSGYGALLRRGLGPNAGGPYLTPAVYLAVNHFVDNALIIISDACAMPPPDTAAAAAASSSNSTNSFGGSGTTAPAAAGGSGGGAAAGGQQGGGAFAMDQQGLDARLRSVWLRQSVGEFVLEGFLPQLWVDLRGRCTAALEDPDAFKPQPVGPAGLAGFMARTAAGASTAAMPLGVTPSAAAAAAAAAGVGSSGGSGGAPPPARIRPPASAVPAVGFACQVLLEVMAWMPAMPINAAGTLTGILDAILSRVLEALAEQVAGCLEGAKAGSMALRPSLALVMATEPDATLLAQEDPSAFYVPAGSSSSSSSSSSAAAAAGVLKLWGQAAAFEDYEGFLKHLKAADKPVLVPGHHRSPVKVRGLGLEGESAGEEVLLLCHRERPDPSQLLAGARAGSLVQLAALAEAADWVADNLAHMATHAGPGGSLAPGSWLGRQSSSSSSSSSSSKPSSGRPGSKGGLSNLGRGSPGGPPPRSAGGTAAGGAAAAAGDAAAVSRALLMLSHRYRSLAGVCCRVLRLDLLLLATHQLHALSGVSHLCEEEDVMEVHPCIGSLSRVASRAAEEIAPHLSPRKLSYVCGAVAIAAARCMMWVLQDVSDMNALGVERMIRGLALLQGPLGSLGAPGGPGSAAGPSADVVRAFDRSKSFYTLVGLPASEVVLLAADRPGRYSVAEWESLLQVRVPGRPCEQSDMAALHRALDKHYHLSTGQKVADFFEDVRHTVQVPVQSITGGVTAGFKGGFSQARALLNKAAEAAAATATSVGAAAKRTGGGGGHAAAAGSTGGSTGGDGSRVL